MDDSTKKTLTTIRFEGPRFEDQGLDLDVLSELSAYKKLILETAKEIWRLEHPERERLPKGFEEYFSVKMYGIHPGAVAVDLVRIKPNLDDHLEMLFESEDSFDKAAIIIEETMEAMALDAKLPDAFPLAVIPLFKYLGATLRKDESINAKSPHRTSSSHYNPTIREKFINWQGPKYEDDVDLFAEVRKVDLDEHSFSIRLPDGKKVEGKFSPDREKIVLEALQDHVSTRLRVVGRGEYDRQSGTPLKLVRVDSINPVPVSETGENDEERPIWDVVAEIGASVSNEEWSRVPQDLAVLLDYYLYGTSEDPS
jgi:hypothetical protein